MVKKLFYSFALSCAALLINACSPEPVNRGNFINMQLLKGKEGFLTRPEVEALIGSPSFVDPKNPNKVYYVGSKGTRYTFFIESEKEEQSVMVEYDVNGRLLKVAPIVKSAV
jgi:outer membrane protein assembly factor BamE (lipoprotein component of BamABCDE complex)